MEQTVEKQRLAEIAEMGALDLIDVLVQATAAFVRVYLEEPESSMDSALFELSPVLHAVRMRAAILGASS